MARSVNPPDLRKRRKGSATTCSALRGAGCIGNNYNDPHERVAYQFDSRAGYENDKIEVQ